MESTGEEIWVVTGILLLTVSGFMVGHLNYICRSHIAISAGFSICLIFFFSNFLVFELNFGESAVCLVGELLEGVQNAGCGPIEEQPDMPVLAHLLPPVCSVPAGLNPPVQLGFGLRYLALQAFPHLHDL